MPTDPPSTADPGDPSDNPAAQGGPRSPSPRSDTPPVNQRDADNREYELVIDSDDRLKRHMALHEERRKTERHHVAMNIAELAARTVALVMYVIVFLAGVIVLHYTLPSLSLWLAARIVAFAFLAAAGGVGIGMARRVLTTRFRGRGRGSKSV